MTPALAAIALGLDPTRTLVISQVVRSFGLPFALVPLVLFTRRRDLMGELTNDPLTTIASAFATALIVALNVFLLVPLDGSLLAECVLPTAISLGAHLRARVTLLHVMERAAPATVHGDRHLTAASEAARYLDEVARRVAAGGVVVESHVHPNLEGDVAQSIVAHAADLDADLVILATHGAGGAKRVLFGSVAQQVLRKGVRPVLLIRPPEGQASREAAPTDVRRLLVPLDGQPPAEAALPIASVLAQAYAAELV